MEVGNRTHSKRGSQHSSKHSLSTLHDKVERYKMLNKTTSSIGTGFKMRYEHEKGRFK
jgi:hypothetical protein